MNREEALALLKELKATFDTVESTEFVLLKNDERKGHWELHIEWLPQPNEKLTLLSLSAKYNLEVSFKNGQTSFHKSK